ncbi:energy transducer TonB [Synechococcus sp. JA-2-3B'a(2-13)]|uniref:energy transducer TonB n=1 Tax=Synechococcus sp. (strain JA-2-3B'a(2-13)) TaxID=321332 RepID=UPI0002EE9243|nr:energy transducer TonB [Synechococcus sp. JA-2-3B'a(2-13)]
MQNELNPARDPCSAGIPAQPTAESTSPKPEPAAESRPNQLTDPDPRLSCSQQKREQERRSLPWRLGLANVLSAGLHFIAMSWVGWQPRIREEEEIISFQWVEMADEPPPEPQWIAPVSARESGVSEPRDHVSVRQSQVPSPSEEATSAAAQPLVASAAGSPVPGILPPSPRELEMPQPNRDSASPQQQPKARLENLSAGLAALEQAVADHNWAEALHLTEEWLDHWPLSSPQRQQLQDYRQHLQSLLATSSAAAVETKSAQISPAQSLKPQPERAASSPEVLPQPYLSAPADPHPTLPSPEPIAAPLEEPSPTLPPTFPTRSHSSSLGRTSGIESSRAGPPSLNATADPDWGDYLAQFQERVRQHWMVRRASGSYVTVVQVRLDRQGSLRELRLQTPSEDPLLDAAVLSAIQRSAPFAPLPESYVGEELMLEINVLSGSLQAGSTQNPRN